MMVIAAIITTLALVFTGCEQATDSDKTSTPSYTVRYETVQYRSSARAAGEEPYALVASVRVPSISSDFYRYYMGYTKGVPLSYKTSYAYEGQTPITITWEKSLLTETSVVNSLTKAAEETWGANMSLTTGLKATVGTGDTSPVKAEVETSLEATVGASYGGSISTSSTYETTQTFVSEERESISTTIGANNELPGRYRYALFGTTDVYCEFEIDSTTRAIKNVEIIQCARGDTLAWYIDCIPLDITDFKKNGSGDLFDIPEIDFTKVAAPTTTADEPPPPPPELVTYWTGSKTNEVRVTDTYWYYDEDPRDTFTSNFDFSRLQSEGYKSMTVKVEYQAQEIEDGYVNLYVFKNSVPHTLSTNTSAANLLGQQREIDLPNKNWSNQAFEFDVPLSTYTSNTLILVWEATGSNADDFRLATRAVTVTAKK
jgi:hypothetical protein